MPEQRYHHQWIDKSPIDLPTGKIVCVGRNYAEHAVELGNEVPDTPILFMKPATSLVPMAEPIVLPQGQGEVHHEIEVAVLIGDTLKNVDAKKAQWSIKGYGLALDLTLREVQNQLKEKGQPWERAKAFDGACPVSVFVDARGVSVRQNLEVLLEINSKTRQKGHTGQMLFPIFELISHISQSFTLEPGDIVLTGTPAGVGPLRSGDKLKAKMGNLLQVTTEVL